MIARIFRWLETRRESFPAEQPGMPPTTFWGFIIHYTRPFWPLIASSSALAASVALIEVSLFGFLGDLVDWLGSPTARRSGRTTRTFSSAWALWCWCCCRS